MVAYDLVFPASSVRVECRSTVVTKYGFCLVVETLKFSLLVVP